MWKILNGNSKILKWGFLINTKYLVHNVTSKRLRMLSVQDYQVVVYMQSHLTRPKMMFSRAHSAPSKYSWHTIWRLVVVKLPIRLFSWLFAIQNQIFFHDSIESVKWVTEITTCFRLTICLFFLIRRLKLLKIIENFTLQQILKLPLSESFN